MASISLTTTVPGQAQGSTRLNMTTSGAVGMPNEVFLYQWDLKQGCGHFVAVASLAQLSSTMVGEPTTGPEAQQPYYRLATVSLDFHSLADCQYYAAEIASDIQFLLNEVRRAESAETSTTTLS